MITRSSSSKIFKVPVTLNILYELLDEICLLKEKYYIFESNSLNKMLFLNLYHPFIERLRDYYLPSKYKYLEKEPTSKNVISIIKQICNYHNLNVISKSVYSNSQEQTIYLIEHT